MEIPVANSQPATQASQAYIFHTTSPHLTSRPLIQSVSQSSLPSHPFPSPPLSYPQTKQKQKRKRKKQKPIIPPSSPTEPVQRPSLPLERVHDVQARDRLALRVLRVRDGVADDALEERLEDAAGFFVDHCERTHTVEGLARMEEEGKG